MLEPETEVELAPGFDHMYNPDPSKGKAQGVFVGARATVKSRRIEDGHPMIFVKWDREDWRYMGMVDGWTFESHFRQTQESKGTDLIAEMVARAEQAGKCSHCGADHDAEEMEHFTDEWKRAEEAVLGGDGFLVIAVKGEPTDDPNVLSFDGSIFHAEMSPEAEQALEYQLIHLAAQMTLRRRQP